MLPGNSADSGRPQGVAAARYNLAEIHGSLKQSQQQFGRINKSLNARRGVLTEEMVANLVAGYRYVDTLLEQGDDLLALGNSRLLLELNTLVLCGADAAKRADFASHIQQNQAYFYDNQQGDVGSLLEWQEYHAADNVWERAAGTYIQMLSQPQLFIEGNHRSAILVVSFLLGREGHPPFVLTPGNAKGLLDQSEHIETLQKRSLRMLVRSSKVRRQLANTLRQHLDNRYLQGAQRAGAG